MYRSLYTYSRCPTFGANRSLYQIAIPPTSTSAGRFQGRFATENVVILQGFFQRNLVSVTNEAFPSFFFNCRAAFYCADAAFARNARWRLLSGLIGRPPLLCRLARLAMLALRCASLFRRSICPQKRTSGSRRQRNRRFENRSIIIEAFGIEIKIEKMLDIFRFYDKLSSERALK